MRYILPVVLGAILIGPAHAESLPRQLTNAEKQAIIASFKDKLFDGESARYRWPKVISGNEKAHTYCGFVNAKNRYGAYVGFKQYVSIFGPDGKGGIFAATLKIAGDDDSTAIVAKVCAKDGYSATQIPPE